MMFDERAHDTGRPLRPQSQLPAAAIFKRIHLFFDDIGGFSDRTVEQIQGLKGGGANFVKTKSLENQTGLGFQGLELGRFVGQDVVRAAYGLNFSAHREELYDTKLRPSL